MIYICILQGKPINPDDFRCFYQCLGIAQPTSHSPPFFFGVKMEFASEFAYLIPSMYVVLTYLWLTIKVNVGKYTSPVDAMDVVAKGLVIFTDGAECSFLIKSSSPHFGSEIHVIFQRFFRYFACRFQAQPHSCLCVVLFWVVGFGCSLKRALYIFIKHIFGEISVVPLPSTPVTTRIFTTILRGETAADPKSKPTPLPQKNLKGQQPTSPKTRHTERNRHLPWPLKPTSLKRMEMVSCKHFPNNNLLHPIFCNKQMAIRFQVLSGKAMKLWSKKLGHHFHPPKWFRNSQRNRQLFLGVWDMLQESLGKFFSKVHPFFVALHAWHHYLPLLVPFVSIHQCWWWSSAAVAGYFGWFLFRNQHPCELGKKTRVFGPHIKALLLKVSRKTEVILKKLEHCLWVLFLELGKIRYKLVPSVKLTPHSPWK